MLATVGELLLSGLAYLGPPSAWVWPIQNILCACLAISVARAIQIPCLAPIVLALSALVVYDVASVGFQLIDLGSATLATQPPGDVATTSAAASVSDASKMIPTTKQPCKKPFTMNWWSLNGYFRVVLSIKGFLYKKHCIIQYIVNARNIYYLRDFKSILRNGIPRAVFSNGKIGNIGLCSRIPHWQLLRWAYIDTGCIEVVSMAQSSLPSCMRTCWGLRN
jgi:hypothetical protein